MRQRIRMRAIRVIVLLLAVVTASCDQATEITAPNEADAAYALNGKKLAMILNALDGTAQASITVEPGKPDVARLKVGAHTHYLIVDKKAVRQSTEFTMEVGSTTINGKEIRFIDLNATSVGSNTPNDVGSQGFRPRNVVLCMDAASAGLRTADGVDIFLLTDRSIVRMPKVSKPQDIEAGSTTYVCASIPHFSGFVMGAN